MKTTQTIPLQAAPCQSQVKRFLIKGFLFLTSEKFATFASGIGALVATAGAIVEAPRFIIYGSCVFVAAFTPWAMRCATRDVRQCETGAKQF